MKNIYAINFRWIGAAVVSVLVAFLLYSLITMSRPKGLKIYAPEASGSTVKAGNSSVNSQQFGQIDPIAFSASFGLDYNKQTEPVQIKTEPVKTVASATIESSPEIGPRQVDLFASGYRLKGIVLEKDGNSAAFIFDPTSKKNLVVRQDSSQAMRIISATMRSVRLWTPAGEGSLELEDAKGAKTNQGSGLKPGNAGNFVGAAISHEDLARVVTGEKLLRDTETSANSIAEMVASGHFQVRPERGVFQVEVRRVPDSLAGYGLMPGDKIVGLANRDFRQSQDVAQSLGGLSTNPEPLKIQRGNHTIFLPPPAKSSTSAQGNEAVKMPGMK